MSEKINLLIVDDETQFLNSISRRLEMRGFNVMKAENGRQAIEAAKSQRFDIAILDLKMPEMDGKETLDLLKQEDKHIEVIILTGYGSIDSAIECTKLGAFRYLPKPYELEKLIELLQQAFQEKMKKQYAEDEERMKKIQEISLGNSPLGILQALKELDRS